METKGLPDLSKCQGYHQMRIYDNFWKNGKKMTILNLLGYPQRSGFMVKKPNTVIKLEYEWKYY